MQEEREERFWLLVSLQLSGEATPEELTELQDILHQHPEWALRKEILQNTWRRHPPARVDKKEAFNRHLQRLSSHLATPALRYEEAAPTDSPFSHQTPASLTEQTSAEQAYATAEHPPAIPAAHPDEIPQRHPVPIRRLLRWSAAAAILVLAFFLYKNLRPARPLADNTVSTRPGSKSKIQLPDGTQVWLNADSRLTYQGTFTGSVREVQLTGEAYFDVAKDKDHPFIIHTPSVDIRVLGTAFNVRSYSNEKNTETALFQGSVEVTLRNSPDKKIVLRPNEKLIVRNGSTVVPGTDAGPAAGQGSVADSTDEPLMTLGKVHFQREGADSSAKETLWTKNQLAFDETSLDVVATQLERWYAVRVQITDERLKEGRYSAVFEDESLEQVMEALKLTGNFHYTIRKKEVIITP